MPNNLYALVGDRAEADLRRVQVSHEVQGQLAGLFHAYRDDFFQNVDEEVEFSRDWKADDDELLYISDNAQVEEVVQHIAQGPLHLDPIEPNNFGNQNVRALVFSPNDDGSVLYIQYFYASQHLSRRGYTLWFDGETFTQLNEPGFSIGQKIDAIYMDGRLKFRNFNVIKRIFDVLQAYVEASDEHIEEFAALETVHIEDLDAFKAATNQTTRKLISAVSQEGTMENIPVAVICDRAAEVGLDLVIVEEKLVFPSNRAALKQLLRFLDHGVYNSPLAPDRRFITNSKKPF